MLKGLAITPPVLGRISIGKVVEKNGKRLPEKDDQFTITSQVQNRGGWLLHPLNEELRHGQDGKLRSIPIRLLFNEPDLNFRADYSLFDRNTGRPLCVGNGETCKRLTKDGIQSLPCPSPDGCSLAQGNACKPFGRLNVVIGEDDPLGSFVFRTTGFNSIRTLAARVHYLQAISGTARYQTQGDRVSGAVQRHAGWCQRVPSGGGQDRPGAQRRGSDSGAQPSIWRFRTQPSRSHADLNSKECPQLDRNPDTGSCGGGL